MRNIPIMLGEVEEEPRLHGARVHGVGYEPYCPICTDGVRYYVSVGDGKYRQLMQYHSGDLEEYAMSHDLHWFCWCDMVYGPWNQEGNPAAITNTDPEYDFDTDDSRCYEWHGSYENSCDGDFYVNPSLRG